MLFMLSKQHASVADELWRDVALLNKHGDLLKKVSIPSISLLGGTADTEGKGMLAILRFTRICPWPQDVATLLGIPAHWWSPVVHSGLEATGKFILINGEECTFYRKPPLVRVGEDPQRRQPVPNLRRVSWACCCFDVYMAISVCLTVALSCAVSILLVILGASGWALGIVPFGCGLVVFSIMYLVVRRRNVCGRSTGADERVNLELQA